MGSKDLSGHVGAKIKEFRVRRGMTQQDLAELMGTTKQTIGRYENGNRGVDQDKIFKLAEIFNCSIDDFFPTTGSAESLMNLYNGLSQPRQSKVYSFTRQQFFEQQNSIPERSTYLYGAVSAGTGEWLEDEHKNKIEVPKDTPVHDFALTVNGDSMEPMFQNGEIIFIKRTNDARHGQVVVVSLNGEAYVKKLYKTDKEVRLISLNSKYEDIYLRENDDINLIGTVVL